jgi:hypothetical protein
VEISAAWAGSVSLRLLQLLLWHEHMVHTARRDAFVPFCVDFSMSKRKAWEEDFYSPAYLLPLLFKHGNGKTFIRKEKSAAPYRVTVEQLL